MSREDSSSTTADTSSDSGSESESGILLEVFGVIPKESTSNGGEGIEGEFKDEDLEKMLSQDL